MSSQWTQQFDGSALFPENVSSHSRFWEAVRYLSQRLPNYQAEVYLHWLLNQPRFLEYTTAGLRPLGLAGGRASELLLLLRLCRQGIEVPGLRQYIRAGIQRILAVRRTVDFLAGEYSIFPDQLDEATGETTFSTELSWRYGDLTQVWLLYEAHELLQDAELAKIAELVGLNTLLRTTSQATNITSSQFDRGAAGLATLYRKMYQLSGHPAYQQGYHFWLNQTQQLMQPQLLTGSGLPAGDLRHGAVGVGLVLLSALTEQELGWEELML
ncbi:hypothetical protein GCM10022406_37370 [Hymenobacter algoricola]|uniref:Uncharacterized protein n=1 Tax=Hymenobacter algoricola TaxID=486267 RepID=A0ABP7NQH7_9BACT